MKIALAIARPGPDVNVDHDMPGLYQALIEAGAKVSLVHWDDPNLPWEIFDLVVIRSTWDYSYRWVDFLAWVDRISSSSVPLLNPAETIHWNANKKRYLSTLAAQGVPVVGTRFIDPGELAEFPETAEFVVKPSVGSGSRLAARYAPSEKSTAAAHVASLHQRGLSAMVQPYVQEIEQTGERALLYFGGEPGERSYLHAICKKPLLRPGERYDERREPHPGVELWKPTPEETDLAERALSAAPMSDKLLYGRVDIVGDPHNPMVMELELVEPNLFLRYQPDSTKPVVEAILAAAEQAIRSRTGALAGC